MRRVYPTTDLDQRENEKSPELGPVGPGSGGARGKWVKEARGPEPILKVSIPTREKATKATLGPKPLKVAEGRITLVPTDGDRRINDDDLPRNQEPKAVDPNRLDPQWIMGLGFGQDADFLHRYCVRVVCKVCMCITAAK